MLFQSIFALVSIYGALNVAATDSETIPRLTTSDFDSALQAKPIALVKFFTEWCGVCKKLAPVYQETHDRLKENGIFMCEVDCQKEADLCQELDVQGYPTLKVFRNGQYHSDIDERTSDSLVRLVVRLSQPSCKDLNDDNQIPEFLKGSDLAFVAHIPAGSSDLINMFKNQTTHLHGIADFALVPLKSNEKPKIQTYRNGTLDEDATFTSDSWTDEALRIFLNVERLPLLGHLDENTYDRYWKAGLPIVHLFYMTDDDVASLTAMVRDLSKRFRYKATFGLIDAFAHAAHATSIGLSNQSFPACSIFHPVQLTKFPASQENPLSKEALEKHVESVLSGSIEPFIISDVAPVPNDDHIKIIVRKEFDELVLDPSRDVLVMFYASWCQACKRFSPHFDMLAMSFSHKKDMVTIGKMNLDLNDPPEVDLVIQTIPTLCLFPAAEDGKTVHKNFFKYEGDFSLESIYDFLKQRSTHKVEPQSYNEQDFEEEDDEHVDL